jgi:hypothetical protein
LVLLVIPDMPTGEKAKHVLLTMTSARQYRVIPLTEARAFKSITIVAIILVTMGQYYVSSLTIWPRLAWVAWSFSCTDLTLNVPYSNGVLLWFAVNDLDAVKCCGD